MQLHLLLVLTQLGLLVFLEFGDVLLVLPYAHLFILELFLECFVHLGLGGTLLLTVHTLHLELFGALLLTLYLLL